MTDVAYPGTKDIGCGKEKHCRTHQRPGRNVPCQRRVQESAQAVGNHIKGDNFSGNHLGNGKVRGNGGNNRRNRGYVKRNRDLLKTEEKEYDCLRINVSLV